MDTFEFREFPEEEFKLRCKKARVLMSEKGIDWLFVSEGKNFRYFTGCMPATRNRPAYFFLPLEGNPFILAATYSANAFRNQSWVSEVIDYKVPIKAEKVKKALKEAGVRRARIGTEQNDALFGGFRMDIQFDEFIRLRESMPDCEFLDVSDLLWRLRVIKTDFEVGCLKKACDITGKAYEYMFQSIHPTMTEVDATRLLIQGMMQEGADFPTQYRNVGPCAFIIADASRPFEQPHMPVKKSLKEGDLLHIDTGAIYRGYHADFSRLGIVGKPNDRQRRLWEKSANGIQRSLEKVKSGNPLGEIEVHWHGVGLDVVEFPFIECDKNRLMEVGMTLAIENITVYSDIGERFYLEQNIVVIESGYELLSTVKLDFFEIR